MKQKFSAKILAQVAVLLTMEIVLSRFFSLATPVIKIGFAFVPLAITGMLFGPVWCAASGAMADFIGAILFPIGPYFPGFTLSNALHGLVLGACLYGKKRTWWKVVLGILFNQMILGVFLSAFWLHLLYGSPYWGLIAPRLVQGVIKSVVEIPVILMMIRPVERYAAFAQGRKLI